MIRHFLRQFRTKRVASLFRNNMLRLIFEFEFVEVSMWRVSGGENDPVVGVYDPEPESNGVPLYILMVPAFHNMHKRIILSR